MKTETQPRLADTLAALLSDLKEEDRRREQRIQAAIGRCDKLLKELKSLD